MTTQHSWRNTALAAMGLSILGISVYAAPADLPVPTSDELARVDAALPAEAPASPLKPRKILVFWRTEGYFHQCIPLANQALKMLG